MKILHNARIHTLDSKHPNASAIALDHGRIIALGSDEELLNGYGGQVKFENLEKKIIIPGLIDAHIHLRQYALSLQKVDCETASMSECLEKVAEQAQRTPAGEWILGHGWNQNDWSDLEEGLDGFPTATVLDNFVPNHPVYLTAKSLHAGWCNSMALKSAGIKKETIDQQGGVILRGPDGNPTGILLEEAMRMVSSVIPEPTEEQTVRSILQAQQTLWSMGITGAHDFDRRNCFVALQTIKNRGELGLRVVKSIPLADLRHAVGLGLQTGYGDDYLRIGMVKAFADGALGPHTAAMFQPFEDEPENRGMLLLDAEEILEHGKVAIENGLGLSIHAIGDRANHEVINAFEGLRSFEKESGKPHFRHRIEHVQILHPEDFPRLAQLGVIASMQPIHAISDMYTADRLLGKRAANGYAWRSLLEHGTSMAFGSDAPVESPNPFWGIHAAVTRQRSDGSPKPDGWYSGQCLTRKEALMGYTSGAAFAAGMENRLGMLRPGFLADLLVLESDPLSCPIHEIREIVPIATMVGGKWVYKRSDE